jgi:hypothetical protein
LALIPLGIEGQSGFIGPFDLPCDHRALNFVGKCIQVIRQFGERFSLGFVCGQIEFGDQPLFSCLFAKMLRAKPEPG